MVDSRLSLDWFCSLVGQSEYSPPRQIRADPRQVTLIICLFRVTQSWPNIMGGHFHSSMKPMVGKV